MNFLHLDGGIYIIKNQNGFNQALYDYYYPHWPKKTI